jgi:hypothetical protein
MSDDRRPKFSLSFFEMQSSYSLNEMYGDNYGYRSSLNRSMVNHLQNNELKNSNSNRSKMDCWVQPHPIQESS